MKQDVYLIGDIHGEFSELTKPFNYIENSIFVCVGDFGIGFQKSEEKEMALMDSINKELVLSGNTLYTIRGNHDNPKYFTKDGKRNFTNLKFISDYASFYLAGYNTLFVGGGVSIDRSTRKEGRNYWKDEIISPIPKDLPDNSFGLIITHNAPNFANHSSNNLYDEPGNPVKTDAHNDRKILDELYQRQKDSVKNWFYGHFHNSQSMNWGTTRFRCLDVLEILQLQPKA